jgi:hypothetical protein
VTVRWSRPATGSNPSGYRIVRDGLPLPGGEGADVTLFTDRDVSFGVRYEYRVVALSAQGTSPVSEPAKVRVPAPPVASAQLSGEYIVHLTVRRAHALNSMLGIERPRPGKVASDRWTFEPVCEPPLTGCPARWEGLDGRLVSDGRDWAGTVEGPDARCGNGRTVHAPTRFDLASLEAQGVADAWVVRSFEGSVRISFHCPGFLPSSGSVMVTAIRGRPRPVDAD